MKTIEEIKRILPFIKPIAPGTFGSRIVVNGKEGTVVVGMDECGYEHVSFAPFSQKLPTWEDMATLKDMFWTDEEECYQIMPKKSEYVNLKKNCLHIWRPVNGKTLYDLTKLYGARMITEYKTLCVVCGALASETHHLIFGRGIRPIADADEITAPLCYKCHKKIHGDGTMATLSKICGQLAWEKDAVQNGVDQKDAREAFRKRYGRSWL